MYYANHNVDKIANMLPKNVSQNLQNHCVLLFGATGLYLALTGWLQLPGLHQPSRKNKLSDVKNLNVVFTLRKAESQCCINELLYGS